MKDILKIDVSSLITKNRILNIAIIIFAVIIASNINKSQVKTFGALKESRDTEIKKNAVLGDIIRLEKDVNAYKDFLSKKEVPLVINTIRNIAKEMNIEIISLGPSPERDYGTYIKYFFEVVVNARDYHHASKFISMIENSPDIYMIAESANLRPIFEDREGEQTYKVEAVLVLSTVFFKG